MGKISKRVYCERVQRRCEEIRKQISSVEITEHPERGYLLAQLRRSLAVWQKELDRVF